MWCYIEKRNARDSLLVLRRAHLYGCVGFFISVSLCVFHCWPSYVSCNLPLVYQSHICKNNKSSMIPSRQFSDPALARSSPGLIEKCQGWPLMSRIYAKFNISFIVTADEIRSESFITGDAADFISPPLCLGGKIGCLAIAERFL